MTAPVFRDVDVANLIDDRPIAALQIRVFILCALVALLDGADSQAIGVAGPLIAAQLKMPMGAFAPAFSAGLFGAAIGALAFGPVADRVGRKPMLVFATALFGVFTCLTALADSFSVLVIYRFIAGLGLGGSHPLFHHPVGRIRAQAPAREAGEPALGGLSGRQRRRRFHDVLRRDSFPLADGVLRGRRAYAGGGRRCSLS